MTLDRGALLQVLFKQAMDSNTPFFCRVPLRPKQDSRPYFFQVTSHCPGNRSIIVNAFQEDESLAAQTQVQLEITVPVES